MSIQKIFQAAVCVLLLGVPALHADSITIPHRVAIGNTTYTSGQPFSLSDALEIARWCNDDACEKAWRNKGRYSSGFKQALAFLSDNEISYAAAGSSGFLGKTHHWGRGSQALATSYNRINFALESLYLPGIQDSECLPWYSGVRATQNLQLDIVRAYYRAAIAKRAVDGFHPHFEGMQEGHRELTRNLRTRNVTNPNLSEVEVEQKWIKLKSKFHDAQIEYRGALNELRELLGLPACFEVELSAMTATAVDLKALDLCAMENMALAYRPELKAIPAACCLSNDEVRSCLANLSPYTPLFTGDIVDPGSFDSHLRDVWLRTSDALFLDILDLPCSCEQGGNPATMFWNTRMQIAMGVITQVHLSLLALSDALSQHNYAQELYALESGQLEMGRALELREQPGSGESGDYEIKKAMADASMLRSWANVQIALHQLGNAVGRPSYFMGDGECLVEVVGNYDPNVVVEEQGPLYYEDYLLYCDECFAIQKVLYGPETQKNLTPEEQTAQATIYNRSPRKRIPHDRFGFMGDHETQSWEEHDYLEEGRANTEKRRSRYEERSRYGDEDRYDNDDYEGEEHYDNNDDDFYDERPRGQTRLPSRYSRPPVKGVPPRTPPQ